MLLCSKWSKLRLLTQQWLDWVHDIGQQMETDQEVSAIAGELSSAKMVIHGWLHDGRLRSWTDRPAAYRGDRKLLKHKLREDLLQEPGLCLTVQPSVDTPLDAVGEGTGLASDTTLGGATINQQRPVLFEGSFPRMPTGHRSSCWQMWGNGGKATYWP